MISLVVIIQLLLALTAAVISQDLTASVTYGSSVKLLHKESKAHLHSHSIAWGSGSGQQSVTATGSQSDPGSLWVVKDAVKGQKSYELATPVACGSTISLEHMTTGRNLHSHLFRAPLSGNQEVSGFPDGDTGDNWVIECESPKDKYWRRGSVVTFKHVDTNKYLFTAESYKFTTSNCGHQCPIMGQTEVSAAARKDVRAYWMTGQGVYFAPKLNSKNEEL